MLKKGIAIFSLACSFILAHDFAPTIPVFDMRDLDDENKKGALVEGVRDALHTAGFFAVTDSGIENEVIQKAFAAMEEFYGLASETKMKYMAPWTDGQRGYVPIGSEKAEGAEIGDFKEFYHIGLPYSKEELDRLGYPPNIWPMEMDLETAIVNYMHQLIECRSRVQRVLSLALGEEDDFLFPVTEYGQSLLRAVHYPPMEQNDVSEEMIWCAAHTDINLFTLLPEATAAGLEVEMPDGSWMPVFAKGDSIIVNCGDFLEILSNGYFKSAIHRVVSPAGNVADARNSMVFFVHSDNEYVYEPRSQMIEATGGEKKFPTTQRLEMFFQRMAENQQASRESLQYLSECGIMERLIDLGTASRAAMEELSKHGLASEKVLKALEGQVVLIES